LRVAQRFQTTILRRPGPAASADPEVDTTGAGDLARLVYNERMRRIDHLRARRAARRRPPAKLETLALIVILLLILALTITRSWHHLYWGAR